MQLTFILQMLDAELDRLRKARSIIAPLLAPVPSAAKSASTKNNLKESAS
jgi:hypothetical protein